MTRLEYMYTGARRLVAWRRVYLRVHLKGCLRVQTAQGGVVDPVVTVRVS